MEIAKKEWVKFLQEHIGFMESKTIECNKIVEITFSMPDNERMFELNEKLKLFGDRRLEKINENLYFSSLNRTVVVNDYEMIEELLKHDLLTKIKAMDEEINLLESQKTALQREIISLKDIIKKPLI